jgi:hypothetical protein
MPMNCCRFGQFVFDRDMDPFAFFDTNLPAGKVPNSCTGSNIRAKELDRLSLHWPADFVLRRAQPYIMRYVSNAA